MRYAIMSDYHGANLDGLGVPEFLEEMNVDSIISMGDFDQTRTIRQYLALKARYPTVEVPGNHDLAVLLDQTIFSGTMLAQGKTVHELHRELHADRVALAYIRKLVDGSPPGREGNGMRMFLDGQRLGEKYPALVIHGALAGDMDSFPECPEGIRDIWARLLSDDDHSANFREMEKAGISVMIRGHDHSPAYVYRDAGGIHSESGRDGAAHRLLPGRMHVINPGAIYDGWVAVIDTDADRDGFWEGERVPVLTYHCL
jgi:predicted phosphodiesterase